MGGSGAAGRRERRDMQRNKERVLQAARELFAERGAAVTVSEVAERAGVGVGTIYRRFPSKEHLFIAVRQAACSDARLQLAAAAATTHDPVSRLGALIVVLYRQSLHQAALLDSPRSGVGIPDDAHHGLYPALHTLLSEAIAAGQQLGHLRPGDPAVLATLTLELLRPPAVQRISQATGDCDGAAEQVARFILDGLRASGS